MKYLIIGLGNIGDEYVNTRHNIGFVVADALALAFRKPFESGRHARVARATFKGRAVVIIKPTTYMNLSGKAVRYWMQKERVPLDHLLVIVDDLALPLGILRLRKQGSDGGHNGLISIIETLQSTDFSRLRVGIGNDFMVGRQVDYVLGRWSDEEEKALIPRVETAVGQVKCFMLQGVDRAMSAYNS